MGMCLEKQKVSKMIIQRVISTPSYMTLLIYDIVSPQPLGNYFIQIFTDSHDSHVPMGNWSVPTKGVIGEHKDNLKRYIDSKLDGSFNL